MKRNVTVDILKTIGILLIILAHINDVPKLIMQLRGFDVVLLVIISGTLAINSYSKTTNFVQYFKKRIIRLVIPVWIFVTIFFLGAGIIYLIGGGY